jgi:hypothetical protein
VLWCCGACRAEVVAVCVVGGGCRAIHPPLRPPIPSIHPSSSQNHPPHSALNIHQTPHLTPPLPPPPYTQKQVRKEIVDFLDEPHQIIDCLGVMNTLGGALGQRKLKTLADGPLQGRSRALSISNLGVTDGLFTPTPAGLCIGRTQWGIDEGFVGHSVFLAVASYRGCLNVTLSYSPSIFTKAMAHAFGEGIKARLAAAAVDGGKGGVA